MALETIKREYHKAQQTIKTISVAGTPEAIVSTFTKFSHATFIGLKSETGNGTPNATRVYLGVKSTSQTIPLDPSEIKSISAPPGVLYSLHDWYVDVATNDDGVVVIYA